jgi:hypothetical protein
MGKLSDYCRLPGSKKVEGSKITRSLSLARPGGLLKYGFGMPPGLGTFLFNKKAEP